MGAVARGCADTRGLSCRLSTQLRTHTGCSYYGRVSCEVEFDELPEEPHDHGSRFAAEEVVRKE